MAARNCHVREAHKNGMQVTVRSISAQFNFCPILDSRETTS